MFELVFNDEAYKKLPEKKKSLYVYEWLCYLDRCLPETRTQQIKEIQQKLVDQLVGQFFTLYPGPQIRCLLAKNITTLYNIGNVMSLHDTLEKCHNILKSKEDTQMLQFSRLCALNVISAIYERLGRIVGRSYEETIQILLKLLKQSSLELNFKIEIIKTIQSLIIGLNSAVQILYKDLHYRLKSYLFDKQQEIRCYIAKCLTSMVQYANFMYTIDLDANISICLRAFDDSSSSTCQQIAILLANILFNSIKPQLVKKLNETQQVTKAFSYLIQGFSKQNSKFLKIGSSQVDSSTINNTELRLGISLTYVELAKLMGNTWIEKNLRLFIQKSLQLVELPPKGNTHIDSVYSRKCVHFIIDSLVNQIHNERLKLEICKILITIIQNYMKNRIDETEDLIICALYELSCIITQLSSSTIYLLNDSESSDIIEIILSCLSHQNRSVKVYTSWCLRSLAIALPMLLTPLLDKCINQLSSSSITKETLIQYGLLSVGLIGSVHKCPLGIPSLKAKIIFNLGEEFVTHNAQNIEKVRIGWLMLSSFMTLGCSLVKKHLPRMIILWKSSMQKGHKDLTNEIKSNSLLTWQLSLESRTGVLMSINSMLINCSEDLLHEEDFIKKISGVIDGAILLLSELPNIVKIHGLALKIYAASFRFRLYQILSNLPCYLYEAHYNILLRELVAEFTLTDTQTNTSTSILKQTCNINDYSLIESDFKLNNYLIDSSCSLEHDVTCLYNKENQKTLINQGSLPLGISVIDASIILYGQIYAKISNKYRLQMLNHFHDLLKTAKSTNKQALLTNITTAVYWSLKNLSETKTQINDEQVLRLSHVLIIDNLSSTNVIMRCASGDALGKLSQIANNVVFMNDIAEYLVDKLNSRENSKDILVLSGYSLALGCLHRYIGGMGAGKHLTNGVSTLFKLAQDSSLPVVQIWAIHTLFLIADSGVSMFRSFIEPCIQIIVQCCLDIPNNQSYVYFELGKLLGALLTLLGPELQDEKQSMKDIRQNCLITCQILQENNEPLVKAEAIKCLQELHMFTPKYVDLKKIVPNLIVSMVSNDLLLRKASISCIRQLCQKESTEVCEQTKLFVSEAKITTGLLTIINDSGLEGLLFKLLDIEIDNLIISDIRDTINSIFSCLNETNLKHWISLLKEIAICNSDIDKMSAASSDKDSLKDSNDNGVGDNQNEDEDDENDGETFKPTDENDEANKDVNVKNISPKWPNQVFAVQLLRKLIVHCYNSNHLHFDLKSRIKSHGYLVYFLQDLMQVALKTSGNINDSLKIANLELLQDIIVYFSKVEEPEFEGHFILEQYQAAMGANLRPHFSLETSSYVTAKACQVCSSWITCGVANDLNGLKKIHNLLKSSLDKLDINEIQAFSLPQSTSISLNNLNKYLIYSEICLTVEKLAVLRAWAEVYIVAVRDFDRNCHSENLLHLVQDELVKLSDHWAMFLKDYALISLSSEYFTQLPNEGGSFYHPDLIDICREFYREHWTRVLLAYSVWICENKESCLNLGNDKYIKLLHTFLGVSLEALSNPSASTELVEEELANLLQSIINFIRSNILNDELTKNNEISIELLSTLYRVKLTHDLTSVHLLILSVINELINVKIQNSDTKLTNSQLIKIALNICMHDCIKFFPTTIYNNDQKLIQRNKKIILNSIKKEDISLIINVLDTLRKVFQLSVESTNEYLTLISISFTIVFNLLESQVIMSKIGIDLKLFDDSIYKLLDFLCSFCGNDDNLKADLSDIYQKSAVKLFEIKLLNKVKLIRFFSTFISNCSIDITSLFQSIYGKYVEQIEKVETKDLVVYIDHLTDAIRYSKNQQMSEFLIKENLKCVFSKENLKPLNKNYDLIEKTSEYVVVSSDVMSDKSILLELFLLQLGDSLLNYEVPSDFSQFLTKIIVNISNRFKSELKTILDNNQLIKKRIEQIIQSSSISSSQREQQARKSNISDNALSKKIELKIKFSAYQK